MTVTNPTDVSLSALHEQVEELARQMGAFKVGFADLGPLKGMLVGDPTVFDYTSAISFAVEIPEAAARSALDAPSIEMREAYKQCNKKLKQAGERIVEGLTAAGYKARFIDPAERVVPEKLLGPISHKAIAHLAGMGWIGKNGLLVTNEHGPRQRFGTVLTNMPVDRVISLEENACGDCKVCIEKCPMHALRGPPAFKDHPEDRELVIDWAKCGKYEKALIGDGSHPEKACGKCIASCPKSFPGQ